MPAPLEAMVVMLVEDDPQILAVLKAMIEYQGALVIPVSDARSALQALGRVKPDVLVSDMNMPDRDGRWLVAEARHHGLLKGVPAVLVTALTMTPQQVREAGFDAYLRKPVGPAELSTTLQAVTRREQPSA
jgi:CheY-like chemotaxis protein